MTVDRLGAFLALLFILCGGCEGNSQFKKIPYTTESLYPIRNAPGKYTVAFLKYYRERRYNLPAVAYANDTAKNFIRAGEEVYVVNMGKVAYVCLGSFNEAESVEAKRYLAKAERLAPQFDVISSTSRDISVGKVSTGKRVDRRTKGFRPRIVAIEYLIKLETEKPDMIILYEKPKLQMPK